MTEYETAAPAEDLRALQRLVGTWELSEEASGTVRYEWMPGGHFLQQHVDIAGADGGGSGLEIIGHEHRFGEDPSPLITSRFYGHDGATLDYTYELQDDTLTIWAGEVGSPAYYRGTFSDDDRVLDGSWVYPGGGYRSVATRVG